MSRNIHVTGGSGFLGGHVIPLLVARGDVVTALTRRRAAAERVAELGALPIAGDLDDPASVDDAFAASGASALVNLASLGFGHASTIIAAAEEAGLQRAVFVSTTAIFTRLEARSKSVRLDAERAIRDSSLEWSIIRPSMIYGTPADRNMARLLWLVRRSPVIPVPGGGRGLQQPAHVDDVAAAVVAALDRPAAVGRAYEIAGPEPMTFNEAIDQVAAAVGRRPARVSVPLAPAVIALRVYERVARRPRLRAEQLGRLAEHKTFDITAARRDLDYAPRSFAEGIVQEATALR